MLNTSICTTNVFLLHVCPEFFLVFYFTQSEKKKNIIEHYCHVESIIFVQVLFQYATYIISMLLAAELSSVLK